LVEDEQITAMEVQEMLEEIGYERTHLVDTGKKALEKMQENGIDLVIMDIRLHGSMDGIETVKKIKKDYDVPVLYFTAHSDDETLEDARGTEPEGFLIKPVTEDDLRDSVEVALEPA
jgi:CheY-like chemotaxis protein